MSSTSIESNFNPMPTRYATCDEYSAPYTHVGGLPNVTVERGCDEWESGPLQDHQGAIRDAIETRGDEGR